MHVSCNNGRLRELWRILAVEACAADLPQAALAEAQRGLPQLDGLRGRRLPRTACADDACGLQSFAGPPQATIIGHTTSLDSLTPLYQLHEFRRAYI